MKIGLCSVPPAGHPASLLCMMNSTAISCLFDDIIQQFDKLYKKKVKKLITTVFKILNRYNLL
jgi:tubulin epsilon